MRARCVIKLIGFKRPKKKELGDEEGKTSGESKSISKKCCGERGRASGDLGSQMWGKPPRNNLLFGKPKAGRKRRKGGKGGLNEGEG